MEKKGHFYMGNCIGNQMQHLIFLNFIRLATGIWDLKSQSQGGDQKNHCQEIWVYCIQNDRTEQTNQTEHLKL